MNRDVCGRGVARRIAVCGTVLLALSPGWLVGQAGAATPNPDREAATAAGNAEPIASSTRATPLGLSARAYADQLWNAARTKPELDVRRVLDDVPADAAAAITGSVNALDRSIDQREATRAEKITEVGTKLDEQLAKKDEPKAVSEALKLANEMYLIVTDRPAFVMEPRTQELIKLAEAAARRAESAQDWFLANELFFRLHILLEEQGTYKADVERLSLRLSMMRMYVPESFWKMRNDERISSGKAALPAYNGLGESYADRLKDIDKTMVMRAIRSGARQQIDQVPLKDLLNGGLASIRTMMTTADLQAAFPSLGDDAKRELMLAFVEGRERMLADPKALITASTLGDLIEDLLEMNRKSVDLPEAAMLHEFGNGAMSRLDDFSAIIWPDEGARFDRMTSGQFRGVGVQIQLDDESQMIKVVTPLEGTPAQRAGVRAGDLIKKINGQSAVGISLNQAVDLITGPEDTNVTVHMEREGEELEFDLVRAVIKQPSVKGWRRSGIREDQWDWFIDGEHKIGYLRLLQFTDDTTEELRAAVRDMKAQGLRGLIVDLRFNPGGLLTEAVSVANVFVDNGRIVSTSGTMPGETKDATPGRSMLGNMPVVVLINEGSASASEIVSGAIRHYADLGQVNALLVGARSYGKGSVQNVWSLSPKAKMKLTTQYYMLPDGRVIHKKPGASIWGVDPHLTVDMLPQQTIDSLKLRQDADVMPIDQAGHEVAGGEPKPDPTKLLVDGIDPQLQWALVLLQAKAVASSTATEQALRAQ